MSAARDDRVGMETRMAGAVDQLLVLVEAYPDLKAQPMSGRLMRELRAIEEKIAHGRMVYNDTVNEYNDAVMTMPGGILAKLFGFAARRSFAIERIEREPAGVRL